MLKGTEVRVRVVPTMAARGRADCRATTRTQVAADAVAADGTLTGAFMADKDGFYRIELDAPTGEQVDGVAAVHDRRADRSAADRLVSKPGRDTSASPIEEVFVEARAEDDFGVKDLELVYSVNGGAEKTLRLFDGKKRLAEVTAGHTFYLEELEREAGRLRLLLRARRRQRRRGGAQKRRRATSTSCGSARSARTSSRAVAGRRRWRRRRPAEQVGALSQQQRQIIAATFNVKRDRKTMSADKLRENSTVVALSQAKLREQVEGLLTRMNSRLVQQDPAFKKIAELLPKAVAEMKDAEAQAAGGQPRGRAGARAEGAAAPAEGRRRVRDAGADPANSRAAAAAAAAERDGGGARRLCSSSSSTRWPTSTRPRSARSSSRPTRRSTSWSRS